MLNFFISNVDDEYYATVASNKHNYFDTGL